MMKKTLALILAVLMVLPMMMFTAAAEGTEETSTKVNFVPVVLQGDMDAALTNWIGDWGSQVVLTYDATEKAAVRSWEGKQTEAGWIKFGYKFDSRPVDVTKMAAICFDLYISDVDAMKVNSGGWELELRSPSGNDDNEYRFSQKNLATVYGGELQNGWNHFEIPLSMFSAVDKRTTTKPWI